MKILFVAPRFHTNQYELVNTLLRKNHNVYFHVSTLGPTEDHSLLTPAQLKQSKISLIIEKVFSNGKANRPYYFPKVLDYWRRLKALQPDIIIVRDPYKTYFSFLVTLYSIFLKAKIIFYSQEELYRERKQTTILKQRLFIVIFKAAWMTPIIGNKEKENSRIRHMYYVPIPIKCKTDQQKRNNSFTETPKLLMIGKFHQERKKHLLLIEAINRLSRKNDLRATLVGECVRPEQLERYKFLINKISQFQLSEKIQLLKNIPFNKMEDLYTAHNIFILPAINEPYSISVLEALGYGLPAICTDSCGSKYHITQGVNGYIIKSNSLDDLTTTLEKLVSNRDALAKMRQNSIEFARLNLSGDAFYMHLVHMLKDRFKLEIAT